MKGLNPYSGYRGSYDRGYVGVTFFRSTAIFRDSVAGVALLCRVPDDGVPGSCPECPRLSQFLRAASTGTFRSYSAWSSAWVALHLADLHCKTQIIASLFTFRSLQSALKIHSGRLYVFWLK